MRPRKETIRSAGATIVLACLIAMSIPVADAQDEDGATNELCTGDHADVLSACAWETREGEDPTCDERGEQAARGTEVAVTVGGQEAPLAHLDASATNACQNVFGSPFSFSGVFVNAETGGPASTDTRVWWFEFDTGQQLCFAGVSHSGPAASQSFGTACDPGTGPGEVPIPWGDLMPDDLETGPPAPGPAPTGDVHVTESRCVLVVLSCVTASVSSDITCVLDGETARCSADNVWSFLGASPVEGPGAMESVGSAFLSWCPPEGFCGGIGVGFPYRTCAWDLASEGCSRDVPYTLRSSSVRLEPGQCLEVELSIVGRGFAHAIAEDALPFRAEVEPRGEGAASVCA